MTGQELREHLAARGITVTRFYERYADEVGASGATARDAAKRTAKRWLSQKQKDRQLALSDRTRFPAARAAQIDEALLRAPDQEPPEDPVLKEVLAIRQILDRHFPPNESERHEDQSN